ncbi:MAG TPA: hypothetical protein VIX15_00700, partial [Streptosporangiaceae bacterium]
MLRQQRHPIRERELVPALVALELKGEDGQRPRDREQVRRDGRPVRLDLGRLVSHRAVDRLVAADPRHRAHVDELELLLGLDDVIRLEVAVHQPAVMQVTQGRQDLDGVGDRVLHRHRPAAAARLKQDLLERLAPDVLHHDVPGRFAGAVVRVLDEVIYPNDVGVLHRGQELALSNRRRHGIRVPGIQQALQDHPAITDVAVAR